MKFINWLFGIAPATPRPVNILIMPTVRRLAEEIATSQTMSDVGVKYPTLTDHLVFLRTERDLILAKLDPIRSERDAAVEGMRSEEFKIRTLNNQIKALSQPRLAELDNEIAAIVRSMGARHTGH